MAKIAFIACCVLAIGCHLLALFFMMRAALLTKPHVPWRSAINVFNMLFDESIYTEDGLRAIRKCRRSILGFFLFLVFGVAIGIVTGTAH